MSIHGKNWNRKITARLISKNKVRVVLTCCRVHHENRYDRLNETVQITRFNVVSDKEK